MPRIDAQRKLENFIRSRRVVQMRDLFDLVGSTSRMTIFRHLSGIAYLCSYTHAGRYYTHMDIPRFDVDGLWFYDSIGFSENGSLKKTVTFLVHNSQMGKLHSDLERQLRIRVHNVLLDLVRSSQIERIDLEGRYLYLSAVKEQREKQIKQRDRLPAQVRRAPAAISELVVIEVLAEVIRQSSRHPRVDQVASALAIRQLPIAERDVAAVFDHYDIEKKTSDSR